MSHFGLDSPGIESGGGKSFCTCPYSPGAYPASYAVGTRSFLGAKWLGHGDDRPTPSSVEVKERVVREHETSHLQNTCCQAL